MSKKAEVSNYRWVMFVLCLMALLGQTFAWISPAPLLTIIQSDLKINLGQAGSLLTVITLVGGISYFFGSFFVDKLGLKATLITGLLVFGLGGIASYLAHSFSLIFILRLIVGFGFGLAMPIRGVVIMFWFPPKEQPYVNAAMVVVSYLGMTLAFMITVPILKMVGTWQNTLTVFGVYIFAVALLWAIFGKVKPSEKPKNRSQRAAAVQANQASEKKESGLIQAAKRKEIWFVTAMMMGVMWTFNTFTTFLPTYFQLIRGLDATTAGAISGVLPLAGIFGGATCGIATGRLGMRKIFTWPLFVLMLFGSIGSVSISSGPLLYLAVGIMGFAVAGFFVVYLQIPMDLENISPEAVGGAVAIIHGSSYIISYFTPMVFGLLEAKLGMFTTMVAFGCSMIISIIAGIMMRETGPAAKKRQFRTKITEFGP
jgi:predicted MFS family arabinose efflux permease